MSTADAIHELISEITPHLDSGDKTIAVFLDLAKAFHTVLHELLLKILNKYGIKCTVLKIFGNYLKTRQFVKIK